MPSATVPALVSVLVVSALSFSGAAVLALGPARLRRTIPLLVALAVGALLGGSLLHLLPEAYLHGGLDAGWLVLAGLLGFFLVESAIHWHHHGEDVEDAERHGSVASFAWMNLIGDGIHNFVDGALIAGTWMASPGAGLVTTIAVALHELPQEFGDFGVLLHGGMSPRRALLWNAASAGTAVLGAVLVLLVGGAIGLEQVLVPVAAGGFLYLACADLVPELHRQARERGLLPVVLAILLGVALVTMLPRLLGPGGHAHHHHGPGCGHDHDHDHAPGPEGPGEGGR
jgi:zinc and cadmium transporter